MADLIWEDSYTNSEQLSLRAKTSIGYYMIGLMVGGQSPSDNRLIVSDPLDNILFIGKPIDILRAKEMCQENFDNT